VQQELYASAVLKYSITPHWVAVASADWAFNALDFVTNVSFEDFKYPTRNTGLVNLATKYVNERLTVGGNVLLTQTLEATRTGDAADNKQKLTPSVNLSYKLLEEKEMRLRFFYKNIYRLPSFNDLYYQKIGSTDLRPENSHQFNLGFSYLENKWQWFDNFSITTDVYYNSVKDKIIATPKDLFYWTMINKDKVEIMGTDIVFNVSKNISKTSNIGLVLNYSYQHAVDKTPNASTYNEQIPYAPPHSGSAALCYSYKDFELGYNVLFSDVRYSGQKDPKNYLKYYQTHSINAAYQLKNWRANVEWINIFNTQYEIVQYYPMPRMNFRASLQYQF